MAELAGWWRKHDHDGVILISPDRDIRLRVRPRVHWNRLSVLLDEAIANTREHAGDNVIVTREPIERLVTIEGESAAVGSAHVVGSTRALRIAVAIAGDDPLACVDAVARDSSAAGASGPCCARIVASRVIERLELGFGARRRRPFGYVRPPGWIGLRRFGATIWLHPDYPRVSGRITMFDARPFTGPAIQRLERLLFMELAGTLREAHLLTPETFALACGLRARSWRVDGKLAGSVAVSRCTATAADDRFLYSGHFEGPSDYVDMFRDVFMSLEPIPHRADSFGSDVSDLLKLDGAR